ncbi:YadA C-terminal domain-containing protein [Pasteurella oralis]|uniref:YadA C-terminal domain-containing protein n=1 Tax=Pasteurella oralis TaxID=1071947 RepID=UPI000C7CBC89|nr:YadA C-terminal domain-containing protein [Pasteurella oralis]
MKHSKTAFLLSIFLSNHIFAAPTTSSSTAYDPNYHLHELDSICNSSTPSNYCNPYGTAESQSLYGELNNMNGYKDSEKINVLVDYTKELIHSVSELQKQADATSIGASTAIENIEKILNAHSSKIAHQGNKIKENTENLSNFSLDTTEQLADLSTKFQQNNFNLLPVNYAQAFRLDNTDIMKQLDHKIQALQQDLRRLDKKMNAGLATQAALSGLFQPDEKHKLNFTASIGGYHTQTALAVGIGYRFNQHVATRAGIAVSPSSRLTYNTAINFAW